MYYTLTHTRSKAPWIIYQWIHELIHLIGENIKLVLKHLNGEKSAAAGIVLVVFISTAFILSNANNPSSFNEEEEEEKNKHRHFN